MLTSGAARGAARFPVQRNSPSRWRFCPPFPQTLGLATYRSPGAASTYSRSVLGARPNLRAAAHRRKGPGNAFDAICGQFCTDSIRLPSLPRAPKGSDQKFTEPVALSSTVPANPRPCDLPVPGSGFDLLALRARCKRKLPRPDTAIQAGRMRNRCNLRTQNCPHFHDFSSGLGTTLWIEPNGAPSSSDGADSGFSQLDITPLLVRTRRRRFAGREIGQKGFRWRPRRTSSS